ncbi:MAG: hypothetical protein ACYC3S_00440 [Chloroflexota bacterium]
MLHPVVLLDLLEAEVAVAEDRLGKRVASLSLIDHYVCCRFIAASGATYTLRLDGRAYDAEPFRVAVVDAGGNPLPPPQWPAGLCHGLHPVTGQPFACVRGAFEYHCHPSHLGDTWDRYRFRIRLADLLDHLLRRCGR